MHKNREIVTFVMYYILIYMTNSIYATYIYVYYASKGFSLFQIGILGAIGPLFSILIQPIWAVLCDKAKYRTTVLKIVLSGALISVLLYPLLPTFFYNIVITVVYMVFSTAIFPISDSISVDKIKKLGFKFSTIRMGGTIGYILVVILAGYYFKNHLDSLFFVNAGFLLLCLTVACFMKNEKSVISKKEQISFSVILKNQKLMFVLMFIFALSIASSFNGSFLSVRINQLHFSNDFVGYACGLAAITEIPILIVISKYYKKYGIINIILFAGFMMATRMIICSFATSIEVLLAAQLLQGFTYMTVHFSTITYINEDLPSNAKSFGQSLLAISQSGFGSILGSIGGGYVSNAVGIAPVFGIIGFSLLAISSVCVMGKFIRLKRLKCRL
jgi:MFS transporter, PPP family, 3-phenylpropionic acid transporter